MNSNLKLIKKLKHWRKLYITKNVPFNVKSSKIKEGDKVRANFVDQGEQTEKIKAKKEE